MVGRATTALFLASLIAAGLTACVPWPGLEDAKTPGRLLEVQTGVTTAEDVKKIFGEPYYQFSDGSLWLFVEDDIYFTLSVIGYTAGSTEDYTTRYMTEFVFDERGVAKEIASTSYNISFLRGHGIKDSGGARSCLPSGICMKDGLVYAPSADDARAKQFKLNQDYCLLYVYSDEEGIHYNKDTYYPRKSDDTRSVGELSATARLRDYYGLVALGDKERPAEESVFFNYLDDGYSYVQVPKGDYRLSFTNPRGYGPGSDTTRSYECRPPDSQFLHVSTETERYTFLSRVKRVVYDDVSEAVGREAIMTRRLMASPLDYARVWAGKPVNPRW